MKLDRETKAVQALGRIDEQTHAVVPPIHIASTFIRDADNLYRSGYSYGRADNATVRELEDIVAMLEEGRSAMAFGSGMSAAIALFAALPKDSLIVAPTVMYWALRKWLAQDAPAIGLRVAFVDMKDTAELEAILMREAVTLVWIETPSNPLWDVIDIAATAAIAHRHGARVAVDSTCATPVLTRPLTLGADFVMHSATKYLNGHSDAIAGILVTASADDLWTRIGAVRSSFGFLLGPFEAFLVTRGIRTLHLRVRASCKTALELATRFEAHPQIVQVLYPGLTTHPQHELAKRQMTGGFGAMLSIRISGGRDKAIATAAKITVWKRATSLGGVESLIEHRASIEGPGTPCPDDLLRLSCGIETVDDLYADLDSALSG